MSFSSYNPSYSSISNAYLKICESSDGRVYAYHCTDTNPADIVKNGFNSHSDSANGFTVENQFEGLYDKYLPENPCFVSKGRWDDDSKYVLKIDITGLELYPDFGHLLDVGAYYDEPDEDGDVLFWWKGNDWEHLEDGKFDNLKRYLRRTNGYLDSCDFDGEASWNLIRTACIDGDELPADRIVEVNGEPFDSSSIFKSYEPSEVNESVYDDYDVDLMNVLEDFKDDKARGIRTKQWNLINPNQYGYALSKFVKEGPELFSFSDRVLDGWIRIIVENTKEIEAIGVLDGREELNGGGVIDHYLVEEEFKDEFDKEYARLKPSADKNNMGIAWLRTNAAYGALDEVGFYDWAVLPDGNSADSDNGVAGVREILYGIEWDSSAADKLVAINRCLDVFHRRSDWSSAFVEGGKSALDKIAAERREMCRYEPTDESLDGMNERKAENIVAMNQIKSFCSCLEPSADGMEYETKHGDIGSLERIFGRDVLSVSEDHDAKTKGASRTGDVLLLNVFITVRGKSNVSDTDAAAIRNSIWRNLVANFGKVVSGLSLMSVGGNELRGTIRISDVVVADKIRKRLADGRYEQMTLL